MIVDEWSFLGHGRSQDSHQVPAVIVIAANNQSKFQYHI